jgi:geranylgeranyl diphosphate synthase type I
MTGGQISPGVLARRKAEVLKTEAREVLEPAYRAVVDEMEPEIRRVAGYHAGWWDADGRPAGYAGKAVRPALTLACARAAAGRPKADRDESGRRDVSQAAVRAAVAVELVHDFSLLHDDVMDGDLIRRHRQTAWAVFGAGPAVLAGDVLLTAAMQQANALVGVTGVRVLAAAVQELCAGQSADLAFEERSDVSPAECLTMAEGKTGALLGAACELGALAGGADPSVTGLYRRFGRQLGVAFQLVDDLLDIWGDPSVTGKPARADLVAGKKTLPVVAALTSGTPAGRRLARLYGREEQLDEAAVAQAAELVEAAGGRAWATAERDRRTRAALEALEQAHPDPQGAADLNTLAALITRRDH